MPPLASSFPPASHQDPAAALDLNGQVWRAGELGGSVAQTVPSGYARLDAELPGGGWPRGALIEVLQKQAGLSEWGLVAPVLAALQLVDASSLVMLVGPPCEPFGPALGARQLHMQRLVRVRAAGHSPAPSLLWATREALQCADVACVLAWLPDARSSHLRRLQIAAHAFDKLLFVFRPLRTAHESSPAPLRLRLEGVPGELGNLHVHVLKRRGPPLAAPVLLATLPARLTALLSASQDRLRRQREAMLALTQPSAVPSSLPPAPVHTRPSLLPSASPQTPRHALDRSASWH